MSVPGTEGNPNPNAGNPNPGAGDPPGGAGGGAGGDGGGAGDGGAGGAGGDGDTISMSEFKRVQADMLKYKQKARDAEVAAESARQKELRDKENWKQLAEENEAKAKDFETKYNGLNQALIDDKKMSALKIEAQKMGIVDANILEKFDFPEVGIETIGNGKLKVTGADKAISNFKAKNPYLFGKQPPTINGNTPNVTTGGQITYEKLEELRIAANKSLGRTSPEWKAYEAAMDQYRKQG